MSLGAWEGSRLCQKNISSLFKDFVMFAWLQLLVYSVEAALDLCHSEYFESGPFFCFSLLVFCVKVEE